jgi:tetratricopeptide (TPR) repeat protein
MNMRAVIIAATILSAGSVSAQTAADHIVLGDKDHAAMNAASALRHYQEAIKVDPNNAEALWRASREAVDLGEFNDASRDSLYQLGAALARRAVQADPKSSMAHFALAKALGRRALSLGKKERVKYAGDVRTEALEALRLDSLNAGALHVLGMWNAEIMRLSGIERFFAKNVLGGKTFGEANWTAAARFLERAASIEPDRIVHRKDLGAVYADRGEKQKARETYQAALALKPVDPNDVQYKKEVEKRLADLR